jgi:hypothetical protein
MFLERRCHSKHLVYKISLHLLQYLCPLPSPASSNTRDYHSHLPKLYNDNADHYPLDHPISTMGLFNFLSDHTPPPLYQHGKLGEPGCHLSTVRPRNPDPSARESSNHRSNRGGLSKAEIFAMTSSLQAPNRRNSTGNAPGFGSALVGPQRGEEAMQELLGQMNERRSSHRSGASGNFPGLENRGINPGFFGQPNPKRTGRSRGSFMQGPMGMGESGGRGRGGGGRLDGVGNSHPAWNMDHVNGSAGAGSQRRRGPTGGLGNMGGFEAMGGIGFGRGGMDGFGGMGSRRGFPP